ncbi:hypothetical protein QLQ12_21475 [Actinoplanes sp. NEAU-A12]|uniref:Uncharacterized protein n=1 Tax=Actinoplanes sandaracinus TaxID=3045177 RepID=A0ABT6WN98_9ACTN|nr:hypothetical protein [Actinoplanes sandaracinus]MDI6101189.1 hypothetical protein [Actinoplanes sandaracinus]
MTRPGPHGGVPDLPAGLAARPRDARRGLPIPPVNVHDGPHGPYVDFTTLNITASADLAAARRCSLCGEPMGYWVAFLGGPRAAELLRYTDPPGHPECMTAALRLCPHIALARHRRARPDRPGSGMMPPGSHGEKPERYVLGITRSYRTRFIPEHGFSVFLPAPFKAVHEYEYGLDGRLNTSPRTR